MRPAKRPAKTKSKTKTKPVQKSQSRFVLFWHNLQTIKGEYLIIGLITVMATVIGAGLLLALTQPALKALTHNITVTQPAPPLPTPTLYPQAINPASEPELTAKAVYVWAPNTNTILYTKNPHLRLSPASITKLMTAIVALKEFPLTAAVTVKDADRSVGQTANLLPGETLTVASLLQALLINSGNDAAVALAQHHPHGYAHFLDLMNQEARNLGLTNTHFTNVSGVTGLDHYSSAYDLALLGYKSWQNEMIKNTVQIKSTTITDITGTYLHPLATTNQLLITDPTVKGIKTGWTLEAGECLLTLVERDGYPIILVVLGSQDRFGETQTLINWAYANFTLH